MATGPMPAIHTQVESQWTRTGASPAPSVCVIVSPPIVYAAPPASRIQPIGLRGRRLATSALHRVGLEHRMYHEPHQLSGGEKQRVAIARAVLGDPPLLLADEPTGALDSRAGATVMELLRELHQAGTTVVVITHDQDIAASLPREVRLKDGRVVHDSGVRDHAYASSGVTA